ncbi:UNVERIFIED_CONTAM: Retrovirus-related Pol polyprotein from transposon TNT 1-94 [Sesamum calycinum]|uniref:Retrovirus-related Pol polyprotein from transposon TNT 1-94 n=1 Tax=Sesamum calycinum TaxID=2727403 RepID=A0AAW2KP28_9LAMI
MPPESLAVTIISGDTALITAAAIGNMAATKILVCKTPDLLYIPNNNGEFPVQIAALYARKDVLQYLISVTRDDFGVNLYAGFCGLKLFVFVVEADYLDIAMDLVKKYPDLARLYPPDAYSVLEKITEKSVSYSERRSWDRFIASCHLSERGMTELHKRNLLHGVKAASSNFVSFVFLENRLKEKSLGGSLYYVTFTDDFCRKVWVYFLKQKSEVFTKFKLWKAEVENQTERMNRSLTERARCLRLNAGLPKSFWAEAVSMTCYLINRSPRASLGGKVAEEVWTGYKKGVKGYKFWDPAARKMVISRDALFDEQSMLQQHQNEMSKIGSISDTLQMELEPHLVATENRGRSHPTFGDPVATESGGRSTTNELPRQG